MRVLLMGTGEFVLPALERLHAAGLLVGAVTRPDQSRGRGMKLTPTPVKARALELGLPVLWPARLKDPQSIEAIRALSPQLAVCADYGALVPREVLELPPLGCVNLHPSLLPMYRGAIPVEGALMAGETRTGVTTFYMNEKWDQGDIILQEEIEIEPEETGGQLRGRLALLGADLLLRTLELISRGVAPRVAQDPLAGCYVRALKKEDLLIDWNEPALKIHNLVRALAPRPGAVAGLGGNPVKILRTRLMPSPPGEPAQGSAAISAPPGRILSLIKGEGPLVATGSGPLLILSLQPAGKGQMSGWAFAQGHRLQPGDRLEGRE